MPNKYDVLAMYNDLLLKGNDPLTAINKLQMTNGITQDDLLTLDKEFLGGTMSTVISNSPLSQSTPNNNVTSNYSDLFGPSVPTPFDPNPTNSNNNGFDPFKF